MYTVPNTGKKEETAAENWSLVKGMVLKRNAKDTKPTLFIAVEKILVTAHLIDPDWAGVTIW